MIQNLLIRELACLAFYLAFEAVDPPQTVLQEPRAIEDFGGGETVAALYCLQHPLQ